MSYQTSENEFFLPSAQYNLSKLPDSIISVLTPEKSKNRLLYSYFNYSYDKVVLFVIDGLGKNYLRKFKENIEFLKIIDKIGSDFFLTCQFPSTTASNVTTIHTGLEVARHGVYEWFYWEPLVDDIIAPVLFSYAKDNNRETLQNKVNPNDIYPTKTVYQKLNQHGVKSFVFQNKKLINTNFSKTLLKGADIKGYGTLSNGLKILAECINEENKKAYYLFYYSDIDKISHEHGPESKKSIKEVKKLFRAIEKFQARLNPDENILFILTSDHGQIALDHEKNVYLNQEFPEIEKYIKRSNDGNLLVPAGSPRDMFLYIEDEMLDDALNSLQDKLYKKAVVCKISYLVKNNYFMKKKICPALQNRLGNLAILPLENWTIWWYEKDVFEVKNLGHHGGLSRDEMEIPLLVWES